MEVENYDTKLNIVEFLGKFTSVDLPSLEVQYKCPKCNNTVSIQDEIAICGNCSTVAKGDQCRSNSNFKGIAMDTETERKYPVSMKHDLLKEIICTPITKKVKTVKNLLLTSYTFTAKTLDGEVTNVAIATLPQNDVFYTFMLKLIFKPGPFSTSILINPSQVSASIRSH